MRGMDGEKYKCQVVRKCPMITQVPLPRVIRGRLFRSPMPGRYADLEKDISEMKSRGISKVICLAPRSEVEEKSPDYAQRLQTGRFPFPVNRELEIQDRCVPDNEGVFRRKVAEVADLLRSGQGVLVHCAAGIGRTGMFLACVLIDLGQTPDQALRVIGRAGADPETPEQEELVKAWRRRRPSGAKSRRKDSR